MHITIVSGTTYTASAVDCGGIIVTESNSGSPTTITIPQGIFSVGCRIYIQQSGTSVATAVAGTNVTFDPGFNVSGVPYALIQTGQFWLDMYATTGSVDSWNVSGDLGA